MPSIQAPGGTPIIFYNGKYRIGKGGSLQDITWPVTIINNSPTDGVVKVIFPDTLTLNNANQYFICGSNGIQFGETSFFNVKIILDGILNYPGLIKNGDGLDDQAPFYSDIFVYNLCVKGGSQASTLSVGAGTIGQLAFKNGVIMNCSVIGGINFNESGQNGGIIGASSNGVTVDTCYTSMTVNNMSGGIAGNFCQNVTVVGCQTYGNLEVSAGGIFGEDATLCIAINSSSYGTIGSDSGGIYGRKAAGCSANSCFSQGDISSTAAGILGSDYGPTQTNTSCNVNNCYSSGTLEGISPTNGIVGSTKDGNDIIPLNCYVGNGAGNWNDLQATNSLQGVNNFNYDYPWFKNTTTASNKPFRSYFGWSPYVTQNIGMGPIRQYSITVEAGQSAGNTKSYTTIYELTPIYSIFYQSPAEPTITIDSSSGVIQTTSNTPNGTYEIAVLEKDNTDKLNILTRVTLTVTGGGGGGGGGGGTTSGSVYNALSRSLGSVPNMFTSLRGAFTVSATQNPDKKKAVKYSSYDEILALKKAVKPVINQK